MSTKTEALRRAILAAGSQKELEARLRALGEKISQQAIALWLKKADGVPPQWAEPIARAIEYQVTPHELHPERYPNPWDALPRRRAKALVLATA